MSDAVDLELDSFKGHNRLLVVFARDENDACLKQQQTLIRDHEKAMSERDMRLFSVLGGATAQAGGSPEEWRARFGVAPDAFTAVLLGKDGAEKTRWSQPVSWAELQTQVDAMPIQPAEIGAQG